MINWLAVLTCMVAAMMIGSFWYSPAGFGNAWMKELGIKPSDVEAMKKKGMQGMWKSYALQAVASIVTAVMLSNIGTYGAATGPLMGAALGFSIWLGFFATTSISHVTWEGRSWKWWAITNGYNLLMLVVMGMILASWK